MTQSLKLGALSVIAFAALGSSAFAQEADVLIEPDAVVALDEMSAFLGSLEQFQITADVTWDDILDLDQLVQVTGQTIYQVHRPNLLKLTQINDKQHRIFFYDGSTVTQYAPAKGVYSVVDAPPRIDAMIKEATEKYGVQFPLADLFFWGTDPAAAERLVLAYYVGKSRINGKSCLHYAYRVAHADAQVWIREYGDPLPCKLTLVNSDEPSRPQYNAILEWDIGAVFADTEFLFAPPPGVGKAVQEPVVPDGN